jgi:hypothetical protein
MALCGELSGICEWKRECCECAPNTSRQIGVRWQTKPVVLPHTDRACSDKNFQWLGFHDRPSGSYLAHHCGAHRVLKFQTPPAGEVQWNQYWGFSADVFLLYYANNMLCNVGWVLGIAIYLFGRRFMCSCGHDHSYCTSTACPSGSYLAHCHVRTIVVQAQEKRGMIMSSHSFKPPSIHAVEDGGFSMISSWYSRLYRNNNNSYRILQLQDGLHVVFDFIISKSSHVSLPEAHNLCTLVFTNNISCGIAKFAQTQPHVIS